jgi:hypothetical protein
MTGNFNKKILVGLTARKGDGWESKVKEIKKYKIKKFVLFIQEIKKENRGKLYKQLINNGFEIPLVHIRQDTDRKELVFLSKKFKTKYFNIHENQFNLLKKWEGFHKKLCLELHYEDYLPKDVDINKIGGFCIDLSHFKASEKKNSKEYEYILKRKNYKKKFICNHLNGYSYEKNCDIHQVSSVKDFDYLISLPKFLFGNTIALEMYNSISEQLNFKKYLVKLLEKKFGRV